MVMLNKNGKVQCGGSIVSSRVILTAAHCLFGERNLSKWQVIVGKHHKDTKDTTERRHTIKRVILHEGFSNLTLLHDIALLVLHEPIHFTTYSIPVCLPPSKNRFTGPCFSTGWGDSKGTGHEDVLKQVRLMRLNGLICNRYLHQSGRSISINRNFCAGNQNADACYGDSGGPFSCRLKGRWYVIGVVSFGADCAQPKWPGIYVDVPKYVRWIKKKLAYFGFPIQH